jgi:hypothetical protein
MLGNFTCSACLSDAGLTMKKNDLTLTFALDEVCIPWVSFYFLPVNVLADVASRKCFKGFDSSRIHYQLIDHIFLKGWVL